MQLDKNLVTSDNQITLWYTQTARYTKYQVPFGGQVGTKVIRKLPFSGQSTKF